jgi:predicted dehydrogenase
MKRLGVGIIGLGMAVKPHALALRDLAGQVDVVGRYSPAPARRAGSPASTGCQRWSWMLCWGHAWSGVDLPAAACRAGSAGAQAASTCCWKPIDIALEPARAVVDAVERAGRKLGVVFQYRFRPGTVTLRKLLREGALGELLSVSCAVRWWRSAEYYAQPGRGMRSRDGGGVLLTQSIHTLDVLLDLAGPVKR